MPTKLTLMPLDEGTKALEMFKLETSQSGALADRLVLPELTAPVAQAGTPERSTTRPHARAKQIRVGSVALIAIAMLTGVGVWAIRSPHGLIAQISSIGSMLSRLNKTADPISPRKADVLNVTPPATTVASSKPAGSPALTRGRTGTVAHPRPVPSDHLPGGEPGKISITNAAVARVQADPISASSTSPGVSRPPALTASATTIAEVAPDPATYTARDVDVVPPATAYPQFLVTFPPDVQHENLPIIEVVVNEHGTVDRVKLRSVPRNLGEYLLVTTSLSAAKSWRFQPALKEGRPVKYLALVVLPAR